MLTLKISNLKQQKVENNMLKLFYLLTWQLACTLCLISMSIKKQATELY